MRHVALRQPCHAAAKKEYGIRIVSYSSYPEDERYLENVWQALQLLEKYHPAKLDRVLRELKHVVLGREAVGNRFVGYFFKVRIGVIVLNRIPCDFSCDQRAVAFAGLLIRAATRGHIAHVQTGLSQWALDRAATACWLEQERINQSLTEKLGVSLGELEERFTE